MHSIRLRPLVVWNLVQIALRRPLEIPVAKLRNALLGKATEAKHWNDLVLI